MKKEEHKHPTVKSESGSELFFNEKGELVGKEVKQGYICPQTKVQCDDECCVSAEDCHIESSKGVLSEERVPHSFCDNCGNDVCCCIIKIQETMYSQEEMVAFLDWTKSTNPYKVWYETRCILEGAAIDSKVLFSMWLKQTKNS